MKNLSLLLLFVTSFTFGFEASESDLERRLESRREKEFQDWTSVIYLQEEFEAMKSKGKFPIYTEGRSDGKIRRIYIRRPDDLQFWSWRSMTVEELSERHQKYKKEGYALMTLGKNPYDEHDPSYWAVWVDQRSERRIQRELRRFGITQASLDL